MAYGCRAHGSASYRGLGRVRYADPSGSSGWGAGAVEIATGGDKVSG